MLVDKVTLACVRHPAKLVYSTTFLVDEESFGCLHQVWFSVFVKIEVTEDLMRIEIKLFDAERSGNLTSRIHVR